MLEIPDDFIDQPFDIYPDREKQVQYMKDFVMGKFKKENWCTYIYGSPGCGKSALAAASLKSFFLKNNCVSGIFLTPRSYFRKLRDVFNDNIAMSNMMDKLENLDLLVFDDFGTGSGSDWEISKVCELLEARFDSKKKTIITSNLSLEDAKEKIDDRLYRRIKEGGIFKLEKSQWHGKENFYQKDISNLQNLSRMKIEPMAVQPYQYKEDD